MFCVLIGRFNSDEEVQAALKEHFPNKEENYLYHGIEIMPKRCTKCVEQIVMKNNKNICFTFTSPPFLGQKHKVPYYVWLSEPATSQALEGSPNDIKAANIFTY